MKLADCDEYDDRKPESLSNGGMKSGLQRTSIKGPCGTDGPWHLPHYLAKDMPCEEVKVSVSVSLVMLSARVELRMTRSRAT